MPAQNEPPAPVRMPTDRPGSAIEPVHRVGQTMGHRGVDRVLGLGPVDGDDQDPVPLFDEDFGFAAASSVLTTL